MLIWEHIICQLVILKKEISKVLFIPFAVC